MRTEDEVLLLAARVELTDEGRRALAGFLHRPLDWSYLTATAEAHRIAPLLCRHLSAHGWEAVPEAAQARLDTVARAAALQGLQALAELGPILSAADRAGLPVLPLKGAALIEQVYAGSCVRPMVDIDLLVPRDALPAAEEVLRGLGYAPFFPPAPVGDPLVRSTGALQFARAGAAFSLDVQWDLASRTLRLLFPVDTEGVWQRSRPMAVAGSPTRTMAGEDLLLYLMMHLFRHGAQTLLGFCDVAETVRRRGGEICWDTLVGRAREWRMDALSAVLLAWVRGHLGAPVPEEALAALGGAGTAAVAPGSPVAPASLIGNRLAVARRQLPFVPRGRRLRWVWRMLFPPLKEVSVATRRGAWSSALYLVRPERIRRAAGQLTRLVLR